MALPAHKSSIFTGVQGPGNPALLNTKPVVESFSSSTNTVNSIVNIAKNLLKNVSPRQARSQDGTMPMQCIVVAKRDGRVQTMKREITLSQAPRNKIKLMTGDDQAAIFEFMYPSAVEKRPGSKVVWVKQSNVQREYFAYVTYSTKMKCLVCISDDIMTRSGVLTAEGTVLLSMLHATIRDGSHIAYRVKMKTRGDEKVVKSPIKISPKVGRFIFCSSLSRFFNNRR